MTHGHRRNYTTLTDVTEILKAEPIHEEIGLRLARFFEQARPFLRQPTAESTLPEHVDFNRLSSFLGRGRPVFPAIR